MPKKRILFFGANSGCGKTLAAECLARNLGLHVVKVKYDFLSEFSFENASFILNDVFNYCREAKYLLLIDNCNFGKNASLISVLLMLLSEYNKYSDISGLVVVTSKNKRSFLYRSDDILKNFDDAIEILLPSKREIYRLLEMTLSGFQTDILKDSNKSLNKIIDMLEGLSASSIVEITMNAAKISIFNSKHTVNISNDTMIQVIRDTINLYFIDNSK